MILLVGNIAFLAAAIFVLARYWGLLTWPPKTFLIAGSVLQLAALSTYAWAP